ncbi:sensor histidine kinase [Salisediminibacterium halotolerans]|uniref:sensor histidine kinase n=1 Tax=Salisediminibacterium halotolerans TaxID=517425 RepID=UPI000EAF1A24|nr:ATP-binding protein [Salisediminibacterium halotolerans]RLJ75422.1 signal transduction histidine kinase [Actinophytocola xinjiangensis]RPE89275.1 signal transduction histidine kinase [Salisediminibacterium halotolerans]TWG36035.1 signal transduction histidine kinase [Salisediminibacterium halotolerans]GEL07492.1 two-component sensor histidine kinase [Salisediminibacterium halotolerans]
MKKYLSVKAKAWILFAAIALFSAGLVASVSFYFYESLYLESQAEILEDQASGLKDAYLHEPEAVFEERLDWTLSSANLYGVVSSDPMALGSAVPLEQPENELVINSLERSQLQNGETVIISRMHEALDTRILGAAVPVVIDDGYLDTVILLYRPVAEINEAFYGIIPAVALIGGIFLFILFILIKRVEQEFIHPILELERHAEELAKGRYERRLHIDVENEIAGLADSFRFLAANLADEDEKKRAFIQNISHELRTPLSYIRGYSELLAGMKDAPDTGRCSEYSAIIYHEASRMNRLVDQLITLTQLEKADDKQTGFSPLVLSELLEEAVRNTQLKRADKEQSMSTEYNDELIIFGDEDRLLQVFINLLDNASRYTPQHGHISAEIKADAGSALIEISDNGEGIAPEKIPYLTDRFYRADKSRSRERGGVGIGLSIVKQIVETHSGELTFSSEPGKGTAVTVHLPLYDADGSEGIG